MQRGKLLVAGEAPHFVDRRVIRRGRQRSTGPESPVTSSMSRSASVAASAPHAEVQPLLPRELADQEDQPAQVALEAPFVAALVERANAGVDLVEQDAGVDEARRERAKEVAG